MEDKYWWIDYWMEFHLARGGAQCTYIFGMILHFFEVAGSFRKKNPIMDNRESHKFLGALEYASQNVIHINYFSLFKVFP